MAWRIAQLVEVGELDNTKPGWTIGWLELTGYRERVELKLAGNCGPDLAGWKFRIIRALPPIEMDYDGDEPPDYSGLDLHQSGSVGTITADQILKHFEMNETELLEHLDAGESPPFVWRKSLYLEWFSLNNGRVVIQDTRLEVERLGERAFELTEDQWLDQSRQVGNEFDYFMLKLGDAINRLNTSGEE